MMSRVLATGLTDGKIELAQSIRYIDEAVDMDIYQS
jgi:hypothetical protein